MSKRITITIDDDISDADALECVLHTVQQGRISSDTKGNKYYCWGIAIPIKEGQAKGLVLWTSRDSKDPNASFRVTHHNYDI